MSFLYDKEVYEKIIKTALPAEKTNPPRVENNNSIYPLVQKLSNKLSRELQGTPEPTNITIDDPSKGDLKMPDIKNIDKFLIYLDESGLKIDGVRVCYSKAEALKLPKDIQDGVILPVPLKQYRQPEDLSSTREWNVADYYVNPKALSALINQLQQNAKNDKNDLSLVILNTLIKKLNALFPNGNFKPQPKAEPGKPRTVDDETILDWFSNFKYFDETNPFYDMSKTGNIVLKAKDLASKESLNNWIMSPPETRIITLENNKKVLHQYSSPQQYLEENANFCIIMQILYKRAYKYSQYTTDPEFSKNSAFYMKRITELTPQFADPNGQACKLIGDQTTTTTQPDGAKPDGTKTDPEIANAIRTIMQQGNLPLDTMDIDFNRIDKFFNLLTPILGKGTPEAIERYNIINNAISIAKGEMAKYSRLMSSRVILLDGNLASFMSVRVGNASPTEALLELQQVITYVKDVLLHFKSAYGPILNTIDPNFNVLNRQFAIYKQNWQKLSSLLDAATKITVKR